MSTAKAHATACTGVQTRDWRGPDKLRVVSLTNHYSRFATLGSTTVPSGKRTTKNICRIGPLVVSEKETSQNGTGCVRLTVFGTSCSSVSKMYSKRAAIHGRTSIPKKLNRHRWKRQQEGNQDCREVVHRLLPSSSAISRGKVNLSKRVWEKLIQLIEAFSDTRIGLLGAARRTPAMDEKIMEDERKRLRGEKWFRFLRGAGLF